MVCSGPFIFPSCFVPFSPGVLSVAFCHVPFVRNVLVWAMNRWVVRHVHVSTPPVSCPQEYGARCRSQCAYQHTHNGLGRHSSVLLGGRTCSDVFHTQDQTRKMHRRRQATGSRGWQAYASRTTWAPHACVPWCDKLTVLKRMGEVPRLHVKTWQNSTGREVAISYPYLVCGRR